MAKQHKTCKHEFRVLWTSAFEVEFGCSRCDEKIRRSLTRSEITWLRKNDLKQDRDSRVIHKLYWSFRKLYMNADGAFKINGYELMRAAKRFTKNHPECKLIVCDDCCHATSYVLFIPHASEVRYWGTTAIIIPQLADPCEMFFYPECGMKQLGNAVRELQHRWHAMRPIEKSHQNDERIDMLADGKFRPEPSEPIDSAYLRRRKKVAEKSLKKLRDGLSGKS